jgi:hypothetical protein
VKTLRMMLCRLIAPRLADELGRLRADHDRQLALRARAHAHAQVLQAKLEVEVRRAVAAEADAGRWRERWLRSEEARSGEVAAADRYAAQLRSYGIQPAGVESLGASV